MKTPLIILFLLTIFSSISLAGERQVLNFTAKWCGGCQTLKSRILPRTDIQKTISRYEYYISIDVDKYPTEAKRYRIKSLPTILITEQMKYIEPSSVLHGTLLFKSKTVIRGRWQPPILGKGVSLLEFLKKHAPKPKKVLDKSPS